MIPVEPDADTPASQRYVFGRLREQLPDAWTVLHARRFSLPARDGGEAEEGEVDFLVIDPERGLLALDVSRGEATDVRTAARSLDGYLRAQPWFERSRTRVPFTWSVVSPDADVSAPLAPELPRERVLGRGDFPNLRAAIDRIFTASDIGRAPLGDEAVAATIRALAPALRLIRPLWARIEREGRALVRLTQEQARILDVLADTPRVAIEGSAGTGKTMLAAEWARRLAEAGQRTLLLCFNRALGDFLARDAEGYAVSSFHRLCYELCQAAGIAFEVPDGERARRAFWDREAARLLLRALESEPDALFDAVVVDEGQDFRPEWWPAVERLLREPEAGRLVVFFDPNQNLYEGGPPPGLVLAPARLAFNCRNTACIARFASAVIGSKAELRPESPEGADVELIHVKTDDETVREVRRLLHRLIRDEGLSPDQIVVLSTRSRERSPLATAGPLGQLELGPLQAEPGSGLVRFGSLHQFKGLEADVVIVIDVHAGDPNSSPRHIYVATSRARHLLVVVQRLDD